MDQHRSLKFVCVLIFVYLAAELERKLKLLSLSKHFPVVFSVDFLSSSCCIVGWYGGKQVVLMFSNTPVLYARQKWQWTDAPTREISHSPGSGSNPATPNSVYKEINKAIIKPSLSLNDYSHKCFNHHSLGAQRCEFVWVGVCVTVLWCPTGLGSAQMGLFSCQPRL